MVAATPQAIAETLAEVDQTRADLHWVALLNYELGFWFEPRLFQLRDFQHPPLMVICFRSARWLARVQFDAWLQAAVASLPKSQARAGIADLRLTKDLCTYRRGVQRILQRIKAGDCYQVGRSIFDISVRHSRCTSYSECNNQSAMERSFSSLDTLCSPFHQNFFSNGGVINCACVR
jgi:anthranilate/para-aminobenzoate synthase component I